MKYYLLFISVLFLSVYSVAQQLRIIKDNVNCTYGLKDEAGNWVVQPTYILIQRYNSGYFAAKNELGEGLLSPTGKPIIECKYDQLRPIQSKWLIVEGYMLDSYQRPSGQSVFFQGNLSDQAVILNARGKEIFQISRYDGVQFDGEAHLLIYGNSPLTSTYIDTLGNVLINKTPGAILPFGSNEFSLHGNGLESYSKVVQGNVRLINKKGEYPLDKQFERAIFGPNKQICFEQDSKYGEMTTSGKLLIAPNYRRQLNLQYSTQRTWVIYSETEHEGLMNPDGTVILEPIYDKIDQARTGSEYEVFWRVQKDGNYGAVDHKGKMVIPLLFDQLNFVYYRSIDGENLITRFLIEKEGKFAYISPNFSPGAIEWYDRLQQIGQSDYSIDATTEFKFVTEQEGKLGLLNADGSRLSKCIYDLRIQFPGNANRHYFSKGLEVFQYNCDIQTFVPIKLSVAASTDKYIIFSDQPYFIKGVVSDNGKEFVSLSFQSNYQEVFGNMMVLNRSETADWEIINTITQEKILIPFIAKIKPFAHKKFIFETRYGKVGILDEDGNILVKADYLELHHNSKSTHLWAMIVTKSRTKKWMLIDEFGKHLISDTLTETFLVNSGDVVMTIDGKNGLFSTNEFKWKIEPKYPCLFKSLGDFYIASEAINRKGILRSDGSIVLPFEYQSIVLLTTNCQEYYDCNQGENLKIRWLARKGSTEIMVDQNGQMVDSYMDILVFKEAILFADRAYIDPFSPLMMTAQIDSDLSTVSSEEKIIPTRLSDEFYYPQVSSFRSFPILESSSFIGVNQSKSKENVNVQTINSALRNSIFHAVNEDWNRDLAHCSLDYRDIVLMSDDTHQPLEATVQPENYFIQDLKTDCACSEQNNTQIRGYGYGSKYYRLKTNGAQFASMEIGFYGENDYRYLTMSQGPPPPPPAKPINFVIRNGSGVSLNLKDIFPSDALLLEEFITALKLRDDLKLDCSNLENMVKQINGRFSLSKEGVHLHYPSYDHWHNQPINFLIPLERLNLHEETKWLVPILTAQ